MPIFGLWSGNSDLVHVGARLMGSDAALALTGRRYIPRPLIDHGVEFAQPTFEAAVADLLEHPVAIQCS